MIIQVENLRKNYADVQAVKGISFNVQEGMLYSFLGTNGAGKSTTINMLTTLLSKASGTALVGGYDIEKQADKVRSLIGIVFQDSVLDEKLTIRENLEIRGSLYGLSGMRLKNAVERAVRLTNIDDYAKRPYEKLSGGQKRRADIARALINQPKLLFLDEPTTGLDPKTRRDIWQMIRDMQKSSGMTVFLTTHYMEEAAESDDIAIINKGQIQAQGSPAMLKEQYGFDKLKLTLSDGQNIEHKLEKTTDALPIIDKYRGDISHVEIISGTLDDVFLNLTEGLSTKNTPAYFLDQPYEKSDEGGLR